MNNIERTGKINNNNLSGEFYFETLVEESIRNNIMTIAEAQRIQLECIALLAKKTGQYTKGKSSSVTAANAQGLLKSILFTLGIALKNYRLPDDAAKALLNKPVEYFFEKGLKKIIALTASCKYIFVLALKNKMKTENEVYNLVFDAIEGFFKIYNPDFSAHEIHITADYPVCNTQNGIAGIEFIEKYLQSIYYENMFCSYYDYKDLSNLLLGYDINYKNMIFNIFQEVLTVAIGCSLCKNPSKRLNLTDKDINLLKKLFIDKNKDETHKLIKNAFERLVNELNITDNNLKAYICKGLKTVEFKITAFKEKLEIVFIKSCTVKNKSYTFILPSKIIDSTLYRQLVDEIRQCRFSKDKIKLIFENLNLIGDIDDLFFDAELSSKEIITVLDKLSDSEIAAIFKKYDADTFSAMDLNDEELFIVTLLQEYVKNKGADYYKKIDSLVENILLSEIKNSEEF